MTLRALVLEGGGMRGTFTAGVLEAFAEMLGDPDGVFDFGVACSAGACNAASYFAGQPWRNRRVYLDYLAGTRFLRWSRRLTGRNVMDIDYLIDEITVELCPLDLDRLTQYSPPLHIGVMDVDSGETRYLNSRQDDLLTALRATCALPAFYRRSVPYQGRRYVDGGVGDPVPVGRAVELGATEIVVILTSAIEDRAEKTRTATWVARWLSSDPAVRRALARRYLRYRESWKLMDSPPPGVTIHVIRPSVPVNVGRATRGRRQLESACDRGYEDGRRFLDSWAPEVRI